MKIFRIIKITLLLSISYTGSANENIEWLSWPVTGIPYQEVDEQILYPRSNDRFMAIVKKNVVIGLREDGVVVWKELPKEESSKEKNNDN